MPMQTLRTIVVHNTYLRISQNSSDNLPLYVYPPIITAQSCLYCREGAKTTKRVSAILLNVIRMIRSANLHYTI